MNRLTKQGKILRVKWFKYNIVNKLNYLYNTDTIGPFMKNKLPIFPSSKKSQRNITEIKKQLFPNFSTQNFMQVE